ncbi:hypothetical protein H2203_009102 [Taxawa tesnikishii (nom. ined.)]|nr:hypothetical protein H2203_009102 [Dothideales sp. JES 119]
MATQAISDGGDPTNLFRQLDSYPWDEDQEFQAGLRAILGPASSPEQVAHLTTRAKCYYFARKHGTPVDFNSYKAWLRDKAGVQPGNNPQFEAETNTQPEPPAVATEDASSACGNAPAPASFAQICEMIAEESPYQASKTFQTQSLKAKGRKAMRPDERSLGRRMLPLLLLPAGQPRLPTLILFYGNPERQQLDFTPQGNLRKPCAMGNQHLSTCAKCPTPEFQYAPLKDYRYIRVLQLLPGLKEEPIRCRIVEVAPDDGMGYEALSYSWGDPRNQTNILCDEKVIRVTVNLHAALLSLRKEDTIRNVWVDAVCIHQHNLDEKASQVRKMKEIYARANNVVIWLGDAADNSDAIMDIIAGLDPEIANHVQLQLPGWDTSTHPGRPQTALQKPISDYRRSRPSGMLNKRLSKTSSSVHGS